MAITAIDGGLGAGKTYTMIALAYDEYLAGRPVFANFPCAFAHRLRSWSEWCAVRSGVLMWDESHLDIDSRSFGSNVAVTPWLTQLRKLSVELLYTTQNFGQVDVRLRNLSDRLIRCTGQRYEDGSRATELMVISLFPEPSLVNQVVLPHSPMLYGLYDTLSVVLPLSGKIPPLEVAFADLIS